MNSKSSMFRFLTQKKTKGPKNEEMKQCDSFFVIFFNFMVLYRCTYENDSLMVFAYVWSAGY